MKGHALLMELFYKIDDCALEVLKKVLSLKPMKSGCGLMSAKSLKKIVKKLDETGSFVGKSGRKRKPVTSTLVENVAKALQKRTNSSVQILVHGELPDL